jgi:hypothetical protein
MEPPRVEPPPPPASPFNPTPQPTAPRGGSGCPKPLIIGCLAVIVLGGIALLAGFFYVGKNASSILQWSLSTTEKGILQQLPQDTTAEEKERLQRAFADVRKGVQDGSVTPERLQPLQFKMLEISRKGKAMTREDVRSLTEMLEGMTAGGPSSGSGATPPG